jgi:hypothetical protein
MYRNCIFCSGELGTNEAIESFPVGRQVAFDASRGRLWAVCGQCGRWNLAPIEERWEPVEAAEKLFRDARMRAQSENIGLARLPDGTRLVRVGSAYEGELAAWRYGSQLIARRKRYIITSAAAMAGSLALWSGVAAIGVGIFGFMGVSSQVNRWKRQRIVHRVKLPGEPDIIVRRWHVPGIGLEAEGFNDFGVSIRDAHRKTPAMTGGGEVRRDSPDVVMLKGASARALLGRAMVAVNEKGATQSKLDEANRMLVDAGGAERLLLRTAFSKHGLGKKAGDTRALVGPASLAFEMALNEESERHALEGELATLAAAWKEAEEIAAIADNLPFELEIRRLLAR